MYPKRIKYCCKRFLVLILAFQILNLSVHSGAQAIMGATVVTIGASNQIDCFFEYFYEDICHLQGYDDAFDQDLNNNKSTSSYKSIFKSLDFPMPIQYTAISKTNFTTAKQNHFPLWDNKYDYLFAQEITPPPPKRSVAS